MNGMYDYLAGQIEAKRRLDGIELAGEPSWNERMVIRGLAHLPITYGPAG
jgi:hypothetical protein